TPVDVLDVLLTLSERQIYEHVRCRLDFCQNTCCHSYSILSSGHLTHSLSSFSAAACDAESHIETDTDREFTNSSHSATKALKVASKSKASRHQTPPVECEHAFRAPPTPPSSQESQHCSALLLHQHELQQHQELQHDIVTATRTLVGDEQLVAVNLNTCTAAGMQQQHVIQTVSTCACCNGTCPNSLTDDLQLDLEILSVQKAFTFDSALNQHLQNANNYHNSNSNNNNKGSLYNNNHHQTGTNSHHTTHKRHKIIRDIELEAHRLILESCLDYRTATSSPSVVACACLTSAIRTILQQRLQRRHHTLDRHTDKQTQYKQQQHHHQQSYQVTNI
ncbi:hypothetical protein GZH46_00193, partial [Fragariocoptes setiger]